MSTAKLLLGTISNTIYRFNGTLAGYNEQASLQLTELTRVEGDVLIPDRSGSSVVNVNPPCTINGLSVVVGSDIYMGFGQIPYDESGKISGKI